jgi:UDPglucose--hexose-1-phosphate uridylyltransferase
MSSVDPVSEPLRDAAGGPRLHHDALAARHVIVAPSRAERPADADLAARGGEPAEWCPFCAGNESRTPPDTLRTPVDTAVPWRARIVANRFPFVAAAAPAAAAEPAAGGRAAHGVHDVVIESAAHETSILGLDAGAWREVWELSRRRLADLAGRGDLAWATVFKNSGSRAGASLEHLHSQLVALDFVPPFMTLELAAAAAAADPFGDLIAAARAEGRVVAETDGVVAVVPSAPRQPFETWLVPVEPAAFFHAATPAHVAAVADLTRWFVTRLERLAPGADYNWWLHQAPHRSAAAAATWHWHLEMLPRLSQLAGFELGTGCHVNPLSAAESARRLRDA